MEKSNNEVDILVNNKPVKHFAHNGKVFIQANKGTEYSIRVKNNSYHRRLFVVTVDGINVVDGQAGGSSKMGYVINGYSSYEVKGFRTTENEVQAFKFSRKEHSYAAKSEVTEGDTSNCGVIGVEVYEEKEKPKPEIIREFIREKEYIPYYPRRKPMIPDPHPFYPPIWYLNSDGVSTLHSHTIMPTKSVDTQHQVYNMSVLRAAETVQDFDTGTEFSKHTIEDKVNETEFEIGRKVTTFLIYYASREALINMGVPVTNPVQIPVVPNAFPSKFCKPPR